MDALVRTNESDARSLALVLARVYLGAVLLVAVWPKLAAEGGFGGRFSGFVGNVALESAHAFYRPFLEGAVLANPELFSLLVVTGEVVAGLALVTGTATRMAAVVAMFLTANYMFAKGAWFWTPSSNDAAFFVLGLVVLVGAAGRTYGVDAWLAEQYPRIPLW